MTLFFFLPMFLMSLTMVRRDDDDLLEMLDAFVVQSSVGVQSFDLPSQRTGFPSGWVGCSCSLIRILSQQSNNLYNRADTMVDRILNIGVSEQPLSPPTPVIPPRDPRTVVGDICFSKSSI
jgi:hypothetical protein